MTPKRIQRKRTKGWRMPEGAVYVGRPGQYGNPFEVGAGTRQIAKERFALHMESYFGWATKSGDHYALENFLRPLRGKDLACWCPLDQPCHADVLLELANAHVPKGKKYRRDHRED